jgi:enamine deaminase RidA (YjgF/YER057c/UK114 family)
MTLERIEPGPRMSKAVIHGDTVYTAGFVSSDTTLDVAGQTANVLAQIDTVLAAAGSDKSQMLRVNIWLADITTFDQMNGVWDAWIPAGQTPGRATVESKMATPEILVEIMVIAARTN